MTQNIPNAVTASAVRSRNLKFNLPTVNPLTRNCLKHSESIRGIFHCFIDAVDEWEEYEKQALIIAVGECGYDFDIAA